MLYRLLKSFPGRALPALFLSLFSFPVLFSCSQDKGRQTPAPAPIEREQVSGDVHPMTDVPLDPASLAAADGNDGFYRAEGLAPEQIDGTAANKALAKALAEKAKKDIEAGAHAQAIVRLQEAAAVSEEAWILSMLADAEYRSGDLRAAAGTLEKIAAEPGSSERLKAIYARLGRESLESGNMDDAAVFFGRASRLDPSDGKLSQALAAAERENSFEAGMDRREGGHFLVKFEGGENAITGHLIGLLLEEAYFKVGSDFGHYPEKRMEALLYSKEAFRDITRSPSWAGAIYDGRIKLPVGGITSKTSALEKVIFHEYTHAVVRELSGGRAPVWLNEGVAQYEEGQSAAPYARALSELASRGSLRLRPLEGSFMNLRAEEAQTAYILSLSATEYIIREFGLFSVRSILERLAEGMALEEAISASLGVSYGELEKDWAASLSGR